MSLMHDLPSLPSAAHPAPVMRDRFPFSRASSLWVCLGYTALVGKSLLEVAVTQELQLFLPAVGNCIRMVLEQQAGVPESEFQGKGAGRW